MPNKKPLYYRFIKRLFDLVFSTCVIVVGLIPALVLSIFIAIDTKGSPIYSQIRVGRNGKPFRIYKFRSMVADSDDVEKYFTPEQLETWKKERKVDDDPRITKLGNTIRKTSIDEFPQFVNVWFGQIPLRILKMRQVFFKKMLDAFALPAKEVRIIFAVFPQVKAYTVGCLRDLHILLLHFIAAFINHRQFFAEGGLEAETAVKAVV